tara:strand:+ start:2668 stop:3165 length:498 start_codon:yes stop_codon:yes gene_type:complete
MKVSLSKAASMAGITRQTLYRHIEEKGITVEDKDTKRPKIDVSELIRVYGDKVKPDIAQDKKSDAPKASAPVQSAEIEKLREKLKILEEERDRERRQLTDHIEHLQTTLNKEQDMVNRVTAQLTDQRGDSEKRASKLDELEALVKDLAESQNNRRGLFGFKKKSA